MKCRIAGREVELDERFWSRDATRLQGKDILKGIKKKMPSSSFTFTLSGQIRGGKNNMKVGRNGKHYPDKTFAKWRDDAVNDIYQHSIVFHKPTELCIEIYYAAGDLRRRDMPGMMDALFHVLERAQVVEDDAQIKEGHWYQLPLDRASPGVRVVLKPKEQP